MGRQARVLDGIDQRLPAILAAKQRAKDDGIADIIVEEHVDYVPRKRKSTKSNTVDYEAAEAKANSMGVTTRVPAFPHAIFETYKNFFSLWSAFVVSNFALYRIRSSVKVASQNSKLAKAYEARKAEAIARGDEIDEELHLLPEDIEYYKMTNVCTHGCKQAPRGEGIRHPSTTRYTGCKAQLSLEAIWNAVTGSFFLRKKNEVTTHNHTVDEEVFRTYLTSSELTDPVLFKQAIALMSAGGKVRKILSVLNGMSTRRITARMLYNFWHYRVGGGTALNGFIAMVRAYLKYPGATCLLLEDQNGQISGAVFQTKAQRALFEMYGDNLIFDWTHNTNNMGFHVGSFLATTASGHGVSIADFLSLTQSKDTMRVMFEHFLSVNPSARHKTVSFVIDKDYREWDVLLEVFPWAAVLLCQFHVVKWFKEVIADPKYDIPVALRPDVLRCLKTLVYAPNDAVFVRAQGALQDLLNAPQHKRFLDYMQVRWYNCVGMWSNCQRKKVFDATNTTSNRLESTWKQVKDGTGDRRRIDYCLEAIFLYAKTVLEREKDALVAYKAATALHHISHSFIQPMLRDVSGYIAKKITAEWTAFAGASPADYTASPISNSVYSVFVDAFAEPEVQVDTNAGTCSCNSYCSTHVPCRHLFYVAAIVEKRQVYPVGWVAERWRLSCALHLIPQLSEGILQLSTLQVLNVMDGVQDDSASVDFRPLRKTCPDVAVYRLPRRAVSGCVILDDLEKRRIVRQQLEPLVAFLMTQGTAHFAASAMELSTFVADMISTWQANESATAVVEEIDVLGDSADNSVMPTVRISEPNGDEEDATIADRRGSEDHWFQTPPTQETVAYDALAELEHEARTGHQSDPSAVQGVEIAFSPMTAPLPQTFSEMVESWDAGLLPVETERERDMLCHPDIWQVSPFASIDARDPHSTFNSMVISSSTEANPPVACTGSVETLQATRDTMVDANLLRAKAGHDRDTLCHPDMWQVSPFASIDACGPSSTSNPPVNVSATSCTSTYEKRQATNDVNVRPKKLPHPVLPSADEPPISAIVPSAGVVACTPTELLGTLMKSKLPPVLGRGHTKTSLQSSKKFVSRAAYVKQTNPCPIFIDEFVLTLGYLPIPDALNLLPLYPEMFTDTDLKNKKVKLKREATTARLHRINFTIPDDIFRNIRAAIQLAVRSDLPGATITPLGSNVPNEQNVAYLVGTKNTRGFSEDTVRTLDLYRRTRSTLLRWREDIAWLESPVRWDPPADVYRVAFLQDEANAVERQAMTATSVSMRSEIKARLQKAALDTVVYLPVAARYGKRSYAVSMRTIIGVVADATWLNDVAVNFALRALSLRFSDVVVIDSLYQGNLRAPCATLAHTRVVSFPINYDKEHWCCITVVMDWTTHRFFAFLYDPTQSTGYLKRLSTSWKDWCLPLLRQWQVRDAGLGFPAIEVDAIQVVRASMPTQAKNDGWNCGVFTIVQAFGHMANDYELLRREGLTSFELDIIRLRVLWTIVCGAGVVTDPERAAAAQANGATITRLMT